MGLEAHHAVDHLGANRLQHFSPIDIGFLIEAGFELHYDRHLFALAHRLAQQVHHGRIGPGAVNGLLDCQHVGVIHCRTQKREHAVKTLKRQVKQDVFLLELIEDAGRCIQLARKAGFKGRKTQLWPIDQVNHLREPHQIHGPGNTVQGLVRKVKLLE